MGDGTSFVLVSSEFVYKCIGYAFGLIWDTQTLFRV